MIDSISLADQEKQIKKLKRHLEGWRVVLLPLRSVLIWEEQWYPGAIAGVISLIFLLFWSWGPNFLTAFATIGLIINTVDFVVQIATTNLIPANSWTGTKEKAFEDICREIIITYNILVGYVRAFFDLRDTHPHLFHTCLIIFLSIFAWIASAVNNTLLLYIMTITIVMLPGLQYRQLPHKYLGYIFKSIKPGHSNKKLQ